jgi:hypothetical protein
MSVRVLAIGALASSLTSLAPVQCAHDPDPTLRREDTAGDALWNLAQRFEAEHDVKAARETLQYLVDTYPGNRHVGEAKEALKRLGGGATTDGG